jgi:outer membrane protein
MERIQWLSMATKPCIINIILLSMLSITPIRAASLTTVLQDATNNDLGLKAAHSKLTEAKAHLSSLQSLLFPHLSAQAKTAHYQFKSSSEQFRYQDQTIALTGEQALFHLPAWHHYQSAKINYQKESLALLASRQTLQEQVITLYLKLAQNAAQLVVANKQIQLLKKQLKISQAQQKSGLVHQSETALFAAQLAQEQTASNELYHQSLTLQTQLATHTNHYYPSLLGLTQYPQLKAMQHISLKTWHQQANNQNLNVRQAYLARNMAQKNLKAEVAEHSPQAFLSAQWQNKQVIGAATAGAKATQGQTISLGLTLTLPLYSGGSIDAASKKAAAQSEQATLFAYQQQRQLNDQVEQLFLEARNNQMAQKSARLWMKASRQALNATKKQFAQGTHNVIDVLKSIVTNAQAQNAYHQAAYRQIMLYLKLKTLANQLNKPAIHTIAAQLKQSIPLKY